LPLQIRDLLLGIRPLLLGLSDPLFLLSNLFGLALALSIFIG